MPNQPPAPGIDGPEPSAPQTPVRDITPSRATALALNLLGVTMTIAAGIGLAILYALTHVPRDQDTVVFTVGVEDLWGVLGMVVAILLGIVVHELLHGLALKTLGFRPTYGFILMGNALPAMFTTSKGAIMSKRAFAWVALLPGVLLAIVGAWWVAFGPFAGWAVVPAAILFGGACGDLWLTWQALRAPRGSRIEDIKDGIRIHPAA